MRNRIKPNGAYFVGHPVYATMIFLKTISKIKLKERFRARIVQSSKKFLGSYDYWVHVPVTYLQTDAQFIQGIQKK